MCPNVFLQILMRYYGSLCVLVGFYRSLYVVVCFCLLMRSFGLISVLVGLIGSYKS